MVQFESTDINRVISYLFIKKTFDSFLFIEGTLKTDLSYVFDGRISKEFYPENEQKQLTSEYVDYGRMRSLYCPLLMNRYLPLSAKMTLQLSAQKMRELIGENNAVKGLILNIRIERDKATFTTGVNYSGFTMDKTPEKTWDEYLANSLKLLQIPVTQS